MRIRGIKEKVRRLKYCYDTNNPLEIIKELQIVHSILDENELRSHINKDDNYLKEKIINGCYFKSKNIKFILINSSLDDIERRNAYAHELGHSILHPDLNTFYLYKYTNANIRKYENEADIFASELLLDDDIFEKYEGLSIYDIARYENVSVELVELKFKNRNR